ncbi:MAG: dodecin domain-containing protein [Ectothiorhodospiraceae bacterium]|nr:dodecin domain-containing protein [Ectothiorhodospiraceae bacterium]
MAAAKVIEISAESDQRFGDAIKQGIEQAAQTVDKIRGSASRSRRPR